MDYAHIMFVVRATLFVDAKSMMFDVRATLFVNAVIVFRGVRIYIVGFQVIR